MNISVIIPVYNGAATIIEAIDSVIKQKIDGDITYNIEIIVVNDGSQDNTLNILARYIEEIKAKNIKVINTENGGVSCARNIGIKAAKYEWVAFLDADDVWCENKLSIQIKHIKSIKSPVNFIGSARNHEELYLYGKKITSLYKVKPLDLLIKIFPQTSTALVKKEALLNCGLYDVNMTHCEDADLWIRICSLNGGFYYHPESTVITGGGKYNVGVSGLSSDLKKMEAGICQMLRKTYLRGQISYFSYIFFYMFYKVKYIRRLTIVWIRWFM
ncbi:TPA: glycosyltransferase family 2 protein [Escherichia coli]